MPNAAFYYESDWDYYNDNMTYTDKIIEGINDCEIEADMYLDWAMYIYPELSAEHLLDNEGIKTEYAEFIQEIEADPS